MTHLHLQSLCSRDLGLTQGSWSFHYMSSANQESVSAVNHDISLCKRALGHQCDTNYTKLKNDFMENVLWLFSLVHVPYTNMEEAGFITYTVASHQVAIETLWLHFSGTVMLYIFYIQSGMYSGYRALHFCLYHNLRTGGMKPLLKRTSAVSTKLEIIPTKWPDDLPPANSSLSGNR